MSQVGFAVIFNREQELPFYTKLLHDMRDVGCDAIEVHNHRRDGFEQTPELVNLLKTFGYLSIHASDFVSEQASLREVTYYKELADTIGAAAVTIHPHAMRDAGWDWLRPHLGSRVSFENMDRRKPFGTSVEDMEKVFDTYPRARFTYDTNHSYTLDPTMATSDAYLPLFEGRDGHYHISGFADDQLPHTTLRSTRQNRIIHAVKTDHPIIIESFGSNIQDFPAEYEYVTNVLGK